MDRADLLIEEVQDDNLDEKGPPPSPAATTVTSNTALLARRGDWVVVSGSSFDIISPAEMTVAERKRIYALDNPARLNTAQAEAAVDRAVSLTPSTGTLARPLVAWVSLRGWRMFLRSGNGAIPMV